MNLNRPIILYMHAGSGNHGCEAIVNSTLKIIAAKRKEANVDTEIPVIVATNSIAEDRRYSVGKLEKKGLCRLVEDRHIDRELIPHVVYYAYWKLTGDRESFLRFQFRDTFRLYDKAVKSYKSSHPEAEFTDKPLAVSIGGDNYCYPEMVDDLILAHNVFRKKGFETILWGCSIEPKALKSQKLMGDLAAFSRIYARESITFNALEMAGIDRNKLVLRNDPAFILETGKVKLPDKFIKDKTVGINLSPMVQEKETVPGITLANYKNFIKYILNETDQNIALIPHVVWPSSDDRKPLKSLYDEFEHTGRVVMIKDCSAIDLKGYISQCSFFVGARTHSTIAAYSSSVPTLVIGYSVKSRGIATDLFGQYENYVLPVQKLKEPDELIRAYQWMINSTYKKM